MTGRVSLVACAWIASACFPEVGFRDDGGGGAGTGGEVRPNGGSGPGPGGAPQGGGPAGGAPSAGGQGGNGGAPVTTSGPDGGSGAVGAAGGAPPTYPNVECGLPALGPEDPLVQCAPGQICCLDDDGSATAAVDQCADSSADCNQDDTVLACDDASDCPGAECCYIEFKSTCKPSCDAGERKMCESDAECPDDFPNLGLCDQAFGDAGYKDSYKACI